MTSSSGYQWFVDDFDHYWLNGFCLTFIANKPAHLVKGILRSSVGATVIEAEDSDQLFVAGLQDADNGTIMLEYGGYAGRMASVAATLSCDTHITVVTYPAFGSPSFGYVDNGVVVCAFPTRDPESRAGSSPDFLLSDLTEAGLLPVNEPDWDDEDDKPEPIESAAREETEQVYRAISVAAHLTGLPFTQQLLRSFQYFVSFEALHMSGSEAATRWIL